MNTGKIRNLNKFSINRYISSLESVLKWILPYLENVEKLKIFPFVNNVDPSFFPYLNSQRTQPYRTG